MSEYVEWASEVAREAGAMLVVYYERSEERRVGKECRL